MIQLVAKGLIHILITFNSSCFHPATLQGLAVINNVIRALKISMCGPVLIFGWNRVNFLRSSLYGVMFWICDENSVDNAGEF